MSTQYRIEFSELQSGLASPVTRFGGQPSWLEMPQWPLSRQTGEPMRFICQVSIPEPLSAGVAPRMAYLFMTDGDEYVDGTWEPERGENAIVIQPAGGPRLVTTMAVPEGPTLYRMVRKPGAARLIPESCEFAASLTKAEEPDFVPEGTRRSSRSEAQSADYDLALSGNKIGGAPLFMQGDEFPPGGPWNLLLQLDSTAVPFSINFGDAGIGFGFISADGSQGRFLWQCA